MATEVSIDDVGKVPQIKLGSKGVLIRIREKPAGLLPEGQSARDVA